MTPRVPRLAPRPRGVEDALAQLSDPGARVIGGGSDLELRLRAGLDMPDVLVPLAELPQLRTVHVGSEVIELGAALTLAELAADPDVRAHAPALARAAASIATPELRARATLAGNLRLDPRCRWFDVPHGEAPPGCWRSGVAACPAVPGARRCVAAAVGDLVPVAIALDAWVCLASAGRRRELPLRRLYRADGLRPHRLAADELITALRVPRSVGEGCLTCTVPVRWQPWGESGFPSVCGALRVDVDRGGADARVLDVLAVVQGIAPRPRVLSQLAELRGATLQDPGLADTLARLVHAGCPHVDTLAPDPEFRRHALAVAMKRGWLEVTRSLAAAAAPAAAAP